MEKGDELRINFPREEAKIVFLKDTNPYKKLNSKSSIYIRKCKLYLKEISEGKNVENNIENLLHSIKQGINMSTILGKDFFPYDKVLGHLNNDNVYVRINVFKILYFCKDFGDFPTDVFIQNDVLKLMLTMFYDCDTENSEIRKILYGFFFKMTVFNSETKTLLLNQPNFVKCFNDKDIGANGMRLLLHFVSSQESVDENVFYSLIVILKVKFHGIKSSEFLGVISYITEFDIPTIPDKYELNICEYVVRLIMCTNSPSIIQAVQPIYQTVGMDINSYSQVILNCLLDTPQIENDTFLVWCIQFIKNISLNREMYTKLHSYLLNIYNRVNFQVQLEIMELICALDVSHFVNDDLNIIVSFLNDDKYAFSALGKILALIQNSSSTACVIKDLDIADYIEELCESSDMNISKLASQIRGMIMDINLL